MDRPVTTETLAGRSTSALTNQAGLAYRQFPGELDRVGISDLRHGQIPLQEAEVCIATGAARAGEDHSA